MSEFHYYGSFEDDWFEHRKQLEKKEELSRQNSKKSRDFSGETPDTPDYDPWTDSYY